MGMIASGVVMYSVMLATGSTLFSAGEHEIETAAQAASALKPIAGEAAGALFALGIIGVGALAVPVMTAGAAYDIAQTLGWRCSLAAKLREAPLFYLAMGVITLVAAGLEFVGLNPMKALVWAGVVQGLSTPPLLLLVMLMTNDRRIMGERVNGLGVNLLGWTTTAVIFAASLGLIAVWIAPLSR